MKIIQPSYTIEHMDDGDAILQRIERAGRTCYKSEKKITQKSARAFAAMLLDTKEGTKKPHESVIEHEVATVRFVCDRGISHEIVRHRLAAYSQESTRYCVAGDTKLTCKNPHQRFTVEELYGAKQTSSNGSWKRLLIRKMNLATGELGWGKVADVLHAGFKQTIRLSTHLGYTIICTPDHELLIEGNVWVPARSVLGRKIAVNGIPRRGVANIGRVPWNKGLKATDNEKVAQACRGLREHHWNGGHTTVPLRPSERVAVRTESTYRKLAKESCELCGRPEVVDVHHIDEDRSNNEDANLATLCPSCHSRVHSKNLLFAHFDVVEKIENAGCRDVFDISMADDDKNFVANGIVVHNCNYSKDRFGNEISVIDLRPFMAGDAESIKTWHLACLSAEAKYFELIKQGRSPQIARSVLPNSLKTEIVVTYNMREWRHFFRMRADPPAHPQMRQLSCPLLREFRTRIPVLFDGVGDVDCLPEGIPPAISLGGYQ